MVPILNSTDPILLFEKFKVISCLKKDACGSVYLADHIYLNKQVLLKVLHTESIPDPSVLDRFKREAKIMARLDHPNIIRVLDFGQLGTDFYLSFEFFMSRNLREVLTQTILNRQQQKNILIQLLLGLAAAHHIGIIHRDIKPENILIDEQGRLKIADFGLALAAGESSLTQKSSIVGTPAYMSPEQILGEALTEQSDLFSFGIVACEMITGKNPFIGHDINNTFHNILSADPQTLLSDLGDLDEKAGMVLLRCLQRERNKRFQSANEILSLLDSEGQYVRTAPERVRSGKKHQILTGIIVILLLLLILVWNGNQHENKVASFPVSTDSTLESGLAPVSSRPAENGSTIPEPALPVLYTADSKIDNAGGKFIFIGTPMTTILIDSQEIGQTPLSGSVILPAGTHSLYLLHKEFPRYVGEIEIKSGASLIVQMSLDTLFGYLNCQIYPWGELFIDGRNMGQSPFLKPIVLEPGEHLLTIHNPLLPEFQQKIYISRKETTAVKINLDQKPE
jgi:eukaryotic-like serine/threonine-protein kinase